jgi:protein-tyrosine phosphatase
MSKKFLTLLLILPMLVYGCTEQPVPDEGDDPKDPTEQPEDKPEDPEPDPQEEVDPYEGAAPEVKDGDTVAATNPLVQKFIDGVNYPDHDWSFTEIFDYYGGFNGKTYNENGEEDPNGTALTWANAQKEWPDGDRPMRYSIRWKKEDLEKGVLNLHLSDQLGWKGDWEITAGSCFVEVSNLVPNDKYTYSVTTESGKVVAQGSFNTTGSVHQCFFRANQKGTKGARNCRDLGGWKTLDGKTIKYRKVYRGGRLNDPWETMLNATGRKEVLFEGIGAQLELRGSDDYVKTPAVTGLDHCAPVIEEGGKVMLGVTKPSAKNCAKWLKFDQGRDDITNVGSYTPTNEEYAAFQEAYKAKTRQCFEFVMNSVKNNKPVYFHCSLGRDRTGTMQVLIMGVLGVREGDISKEYELTYFAPIGFSVSSSDQSSNPEPIFKNDRTHWVYSDIVPYFWGLANDGKNGETFAQGVEKYLVEVAGVSKAAIDEFRSLMLE